MKIDYGSLILGSLNPENMKQVVVGNLASQQGLWRFADHYQFSNKGGLAFHVFPNRYALSNKTPLSTSPRQMEDVTRYNDLTEEIGSYAINEISQNGTGGGSKFDIISASKYEPSFLERIISRKNRSEVDHLYDFKDFDEDRESLKNLSIGYKIVSSQEKFELFLNTLEKHSKKLSNMYSELLNLSDKLRNSTNNV